MIGNGKRCRCRRPAAEECHFGLDTDEHIVIGAIGFRFQEDIATIMG